MDSKLNSLVILSFIQKFSAFSVEPFQPIVRVERIFWLFALLGFFLFAGFSCAPTQQIVNKETEAKWLSYLEDGRTAKQQVLLRLGLPSAQFEGEKILTYRMKLSKKEGLVVVSRESDAKNPWLSQWVRAEYSLVLIFDDQHVLKRHSLLHVR